jgi:hypothetical protein
MSIAAIKAGKAFYEIFAEDKTKSGLSSAEQGLMRFGARIGIIGASMAAFSATAMTGIAALVKSFAGAGDEISDAMNVTGLSSEFLQTMQFRAADAGVSFNALIGSLTKFNMVLAKAASKGGKVVGLDAKSLMSMDPDERIKAVIDAIDSIPDPAMRAKAAMEAFGKSGAKLLPAFEGGAEALNAAMADLQSRGLIMSDEDRQLAVEAEGAFLSLSLAMSRVSQVIAAALAPAFIKVAAVVQSGTEAVVEFLDNNRTLIAALGTGVAIIGAVGVALMGLGAAAIFASLATTGLGILMTALGAVAGFLTSPFFIIAAAITACAVAAGTAVYHLDQVHRGGAGFKAVSDAASEAARSVDAVAQALMGGEWGLAFDFIATSLEQAFDTAILSIKQKWSDLTTFIATSNPFASDEEVGIIKQDAKANLRDDQQALLDSTSRLLDLQAKIANLKKEGGPLARTSSRIALESASGAIRDLQTGGVLSAAAAERINQSAPGNQWQDKLVSETEKQTGVLEEIRDGIDGIEGLVVE